MKPFKYLIICATAWIGCQEARAQQAIKPRLVVQIVVSQMRYDYLDRFRDNFCDNGFRAFMEKGTNFTNARHSYMQTNTVAGLATIVTGTPPSGHGVIAESWYNFTTGDSVNLIADSRATGLECEDGEGRYSALNLTAATLGDRLKESDPKSKSIALAADPYSAIVCGGPSSDVYWMNTGHGTWVSSSYYFEKLPYWVKKYNETAFASTLLDREWTPDKSFESYRNTDTTVLSFIPDTQSGIGNFLRGIVRIFKKDDPRTDYAMLQYMPAGNTLVSSFARETIVQEELGKDNHTDLLTICYDTPRLICERFGPRSIEVEDMYYKLDREIGELVTFIQAQFEPGEVVIALTSDHGSSDTFREQSRIPMGLFNAEQFKIIMNGFLSAQYEPGEWVLGYRDRQLYLNRELIYKYGFDLAEVQTRAAAFALQFRGVSGALTSTDMQSGYFGKGYGEKMQNGFYPKRSGDVTINLMPGWIEQRTGIVSLSGSLYEYDTHVPMMLLGGSVPAATVERDVTVSSLAPTLAHIMRITVPNAATGAILDEAMTINEAQDEIIGEFSVFDEWLDKYEYLIELSGSLPAIGEEHRNEQFLIRGCQSRVWVDAELRDGKIYFTADSDAIITKGIIALLIRVLSGRTPQEIVDSDLYFIDRIGLRENLSPTRANGLLAMIKQMKLYALAYQNKQ